MRFGANHPTSYAAWAALVALLAYGALGLPVFGDSDAAWHLMAGRKILVSGQVPAIDQWAYTTAGSPARWVNLSWLFDVDMAIWFRLGGFPLLYVICLGWCAALVGGAATLARTLSGKGWIGAVAGLVVWLALLPSVQYRPQLVTFTLALILYALLRFGANSGLRPALTICGVMALWANCHGGFPAGFIILACFLADALWRRAQTEARWLGAVMLIAFAAVWVNPYGIGLVGGLMGTIGHPVTAYVAEWQPLDPVQHGPLLAIAAFLAVCVGRRVPMSVADRLLGALWLILALTGVRYLPLAALLGVPAMAFALAGGADKAPVATEAPDAHRRWQGALVPALLALAVMVWLAAGSPRTGNLREPGRFFPAQTAPNGLIATLLERYDAQGDGRIWNDAAFGAFITYAGDGRVPVFIDSRLATAFSDAVITEYLTIQNARPGWEDALARHNVTTLLTRAGTPIHDALAANPGWRSIAEENGATLWVRVQPGDR